MGAFTKSVMSVMGQEPSFSPYQANVRYAPKAANSIPRPIAALSNRVCDNSLFKGLSGISTIAIASAPSAEYVELALAIGVSSVVVRPFSINTLMSHVGRAINRNANITVLD